MAAQLTGVVSSKHKRKTFQIRLCLVSGYFARFTIPPFTPSDHLQVLSELLLDLIGNNLWSSPLSLLFWFKKRAFKNEPTNK